MGSSEIFEKSRRFAEAGMEASQCQDLAKTINEEFGKMLPASM